MPPDDIEAWGAMHQRVQALEKMVIKHQRGLNQMSEALLDTSRALHAAERLAMSAAVVIGQIAPDPLRATEDLRTYALDALPQEGDGAGEVREHLEIALTKIETTILALRDQRQSGE